MPKVINAITPAGATFPVVDDSNIGGGIKQVANSTARLAITSGCRKQGMRVWQIDTNAEYMLVGGIADGNWVEVKKISNASPEGVVTGCFQGQTLTQVSTVGDGSASESNWIFNGTVGANTGWVPVEGSSFNVAATETFARSGAAYDILDGTSVADGVKSTRALYYPAYKTEPSSPITKLTITGKSLRCVTKLGTFLAGNSSTGNSVMYRSTDWGQSWTTVRAGSAAAGYQIRNIIAVDGPSKEILFAFISESAATLITSVDDGVTWTTQLLDATERTALSYATFDFDGAIQVENKTGVATGSCKILLCPYGGKLSRNSASEAVLGANRVFRSTATLTQIEAGTAPGFEMLWKMNMADFYGPSVNGSPGFNVKAANVLVAPTTADSGAANSITKTGAFGAISANRSYVEILAGAGAGSVRLITSATADTITAGANFSATADATTEFRVVDLEAIASALHLHSSVYDGTNDKLYLGFGDTTSRCIVCISGVYALTGLALASDIAGQPVNWSATTLITQRTQPTSLRLAGTKIVIQAADANFAGYYDTSDGLLHGTLWDYLAPSATTQLYQTYEGLLINGVDVVAIARSSSEGGLFVGDATVFDGLVRVERQATATRELIGGNPTSNWFGGGTIAGRVETISTFTGVYLGDAQTNLAPNWDFSAGTGSAPTSWSSGSLAGVTTTRANTYTPLFGGNYVYRWDYASGTPTPEGYSLVDATAGTTYELSFRVRGSKASNTYAAIWWYAGASFLDVSNGTIFGQSNLQSDWHRITVTGTAVATTTKARLYIKSSSAWSSGQLDITSPTFVATPTSPNRPNGGAAETLREAYAVGAYALNRRTKLEFYLRGVKNSLTDVARTEDIVSIESHDGQRVLLQYTDNGSGTKAFSMTTYDSTGTLIATTSLGYIRHYIFDVMKIVIKNDAGMLTARIETPSESITGAQSWYLPWWPKTVAYGENQWTPGTRYVGWYAHIGVKQQ